MIALALRDLDVHTDNNLVGWTLIKYVKYKPSSGC